MTKEHEASRTLVKSPPELWAECSDPGSLARHLGEFGEITITRLEPETTVAWEGEHASGTVQIEPSGWGTRVTLTAQTKGEEPEASSGATVVEEIEPVEAVEEVRVVEPNEAVEEVRSVSSTPETAVGEEENDATVEETMEDPEEELSVADAPHARARWRRLTARFRGFFAGAEPVEATEAEAPAELEEEISEPHPEPAPEVEVEAAAEVEPLPEVEPLAEDELVAEVEAEPEIENAAEVEAEPQIENAAEVEPVVDAESILASALDSLGQAHHRPFSRA